MSMNQRRNAGEVGRIDRVPLGLEVLDDGLDVDGVPEGGVMSSSSMTSGKRPYRARWASPYKRVGIRRSPEYCEGQSQDVETRCVFHAMPVSDSTGSRSSIPWHPGHSFHAMPVSDSTPSRSLLTGS